MPRGRRGDGADAVRRDVDRLLEQRHRDDDDDGPGCANVLDWLSWFLVLPLAETAAAALAARMPGPGWTHEPEAWMVLLAGWGIGLFLVDMARKRWTLVARAVHLGGLAYAAVVVAVGLLELVVTADHLRTVVVGGLLLLVLALRAPVRELADRLLHPTAWSS
jgi:hypothetical protein